eukprot:232173-Rhodomonas_salina.1
MCGFALAPRGFSCVYLCTAPNVSKEQRESVCRCIRKHPSRDTEPHPDVMSNTAPEFGISSPSPYTPANTLTSVSSTGPAPRQTPSPTKLPMP